MKYKCLIIDHDDTVVNSTATIHYPCFIQYLEERLPDIAKKYTLSDYFRKNFDPGVVEFFRDEIGLSAEEMAEEEEDIEFISLHQCIKNTSTDGTILTGNQLNTSRRPWTLERTKKIPK